MRLASDRTPYPIPPVYKGETVMNLLAASIYFAGAIALGATFIGWWVRS